MISLSASILLLGILGCSMKHGRGQLFPVRQYPGSPYVSSFVQPRPVNPSGAGNFRAVNRRPASPFRLSSGFTPWRYVNRPPVFFGPTVLPPTERPSTSRNFRQIMTLLAVYSMMGLFNNDDTTTIPPITTQPPPNPGEWAQWSGWGDCNRDECGFHERTRECTGGTGCIGNNKEAQLCNDSPSCPFPGVWSEWGEWGSCAPLCNGGTRVRNRVCSVSEFRCYGLPRETQDCPSDHPHRFEYSNKCYEVFHVGARSVTFAEATGLCAATTTGTPADILSAAQQQLFVTEAINLLTAEGASFNTPEFWLGMTKDGSDVKLSDTTLAPHVDWASNHPINSAARTQIALRISADSSRVGLVNLQPTVTRRGVICRYDP